jgi:osmotically-inducible protein OsmY
MDLRVRVDVKQSVVVLSGAVPSPIAQLSAEEDAWRTPGVADVRNRLTVVSHA